MKHNLLILFVLATLISCSPKKQTMQQTLVEVRTDNIETRKHIIDTVGTEATEDIIYQFLEEQATFPGGADSLSAYLAKHMMYPEEAKSKRIEGTVYLQFIVEKDGSRSDIKVIHSKTHPSMERAAIEAVMGMPAWNPGRQRGVVQRSMYVLPVKFVLPK